MAPIIVPAYAAVFAFVYILLSARVIRARWYARAPIGTKGDIGLERKIRVHGTFAEYVPFALLLATFVEMQNWLHGSFTCFVSRCWQGESSMPMAFPSSARTSVCEWSE